LQALVECYYIVEDYTKLANIVDSVPEGSGLLTNVAYKLQSVGLTDGAAKAFMKAGDIKAAVDCCVLLNQWDQAIELAEKHKLPQIEGLLSKYASHLLDSNKTIAAIELYRKAGRDAESAKLLAKLAADVGKTKVNPMRTKKLYVLAALEVERHRKRTMDITQMASAMTTSGGVSNARTAAAMATQATLATMLKADGESMHGTEGAAARTLDAAWHGAEAYHFYMLAQRQLYEGDVMAAMTTAQRLSLYEDIVDAKDVYSLIALTSYYSKCFGTCSRAFIKLEAMDAIAPADREMFSELALSVFMENRPMDPAEDASRQLKCPTPGCKCPIRPWAINCMQCGANYTACVTSGRPILTTDAVRCKTCRHKSIKSAAEGRKTCSLCHALYDSAGETANAGAAATATSAASQAIRTSSAFTM
jgi:WD repeat-containing protein 35